MLPVQCEAIFNHHPDVARSALVGVGKLGEQYPILIVEPKPNKMPTTPQARKRFITDLLALGDKYEHTRVIQEILFHPSLPVDIRHNAKIQREKLALWAEKRLKSKHLG
jgi:acyl-coenzyme A synthetase/AMP-(fatty) acid ligase